MTFEAKFYSKNHQKLLSLLKQNIEYILFDYIKVIA